MEKLSERVGEGEIDIVTDLNSLYPPTLQGISKDELKEYFKNTWDLYELLFSAIQDDSSYYECPDPLRNPLIFYFGHTASFYINKLILSGIICDGLNEYFEKLFAKGVDPELPEDLKIQDLWPSVNEVRDYRFRVFELVNEVIDAAEFPEQLTSEHPLWALFMGLEHDRIHFETSSVLIRQLDCTLLKRPDNWVYAPSLTNATENPWISIKEGTVNLGKTEPAELFGWDNEFGTLIKQVPAFEVSKNLISNADYLMFVESGAYNNPKYWSEEALQWKERTNTQLPKFWVEENGTYNYRAMFDIIAMPLDWPVEVNAFEARAYCAYMGAEYRLLSEAEFKLLATAEYGNTEPALSNVFNLNMSFGSPTPVGFYEAAHGTSVNDLYGNVWDWLSDDFYPLPGFKAHPYYPDFSEPYFDDQHSMLLGGSWSTSGTGASKYYRLWFRRYFYQHAGFRLAKNKH